MKNIKHKKQTRVRAKMVGTKSRPRLSVHRSGKEIYAQLIDDENAKTIMSYNSLMIKKSEKKGKTKSAISTEVGEKLAALAVKSKVKNVIFDRGSFRFSGRVKSLALGAKKGGLEF
jgi:large subunit ribosomal protein L18